MCAGTILSIVYISTHWFSLCHCEVNTLITPYTQAETGAERLSDLSKATPQGNGEAGFVNPS